MAPYISVIIFIAALVGLFRNPIPSAYSAQLKGFHQEECDALLQFKIGLNDSYASLTSWVNGTDCCTWNGIYCNNQTNHVLEILMDGAAMVTGGIISDSLCSLRYLTRLVIQTGLRGTLPPCFGFLSHLYELDLSENELTGAIPPTLCFMTNLTYLHFRFNKLNGSIPSCVGNLSSLTLMDLSHNKLSGSLPFSLGNLLSLQNLKLEDNDLSGKIPYSVGNLSLLERFEVSYNHLSGSIPSSFAHLSSLVYLIADHNAFNETISSSAIPSSVFGLYLSLHQQTISESFFQNLTKLTYLYLSDCKLNLSTTWIPSFQLSELHLISCQIDGQIPPWISTQYSLTGLELVDNNLVGEIPSWLWEPSSHLLFVTLSNNHLQRLLFPDTISLMPVSYMDFSGNALSGDMPLVWPSDLEVLLLNNNLLKGTIPSSLGNLNQLMQLNLANNNFSGTIPQSLGKLYQLQLLNLANNNLNGVIPSSLANCSDLQVLNLGNNNLEAMMLQNFGKLNYLHSLIVPSNKLKGSFPLSVTSCTSLQILDIGSNFFQGPIPHTIANLSMLRVLVLKENNFTGNIPSEIGKLKNLQILHLSSNHISGSIPETIASIEAMTVVPQEGYVLTVDGWYVYGSEYQDGLNMTSKGVALYYPYILSTLTSIDLSNNELEGEVPSDFGKLKGLRFLNLSKNSIGGFIPYSLAEIRQLEALDLSTNVFSGKLPGELDSLSFLSSFNVSNNNLSGSVPQGGKLNTFSRQSFAGNPNLWGCPLPQNCSWPEFRSPPPTIPTYNSIKKKKIPWFEIAVGLSYGAGLGITLSFIVIKRQFHKFDAVLKYLFPFFRNYKL